MESRPASSVPVSQLAELANSAFANYPGSAVNFSPESLAKWCDDCYVSLPLSHVFSPADDSGDPVAFALMAVRDDKPGHSRLAAMGVRPSSKGKGVGARAIEAVLGAERARGVQVVELEVLQSHEPAVRLYRRTGFTVLRDLVGWQLDERSLGGGGVREEDPDLRECAVSEVDALVRQHGADDLTWQAWGFSRSLGARRAFGLLGRAYCAVTDPGDEARDATELVCLLVPPRWRGRGEAARLVRAMLARFPHRKWVVRPVFPREHGEKIARVVGAEEIEMKEYQMRRRLP